MNKQTVAQPHNRILLIHLYDSLGKKRTIQMINRSVIARSSSWGGCREGLNSGNTEIFYHFETILYNAVMVGMGHYDLSKLVKSYNTTDEL